MDDGSGRPSTRHPSAGQPVLLNSGDMSDDNALDDDEDVHSDASSDLVEVSEEDICDSFVTRDGRLFHSHGSLPYPLPADGLEQHVSHFFRTYLIWRLKVQNEVLKALMGSICPEMQLVREVLASGTGRALDLCTGTGQWVLDMASMFPNVKFIGVDIVPIQTRRPPRNAQFEIADVTEPFRHLDGSFDLVHARCTAFSVSDHKYPIMLREVVRVLRGGGLFISGEFKNYPAFPSRRAESADPNVSCPSFHRFLMLTAQALHRLGVRLNLFHKIPLLLEESGSFYGISRRSFQLPIGNRHPEESNRILGSQAAEIFINFVKAMESFLRSSGIITREHLQELMRGSIYELQHVNGLVMDYDVVCARKR
ncbi:S-adenosyl-L-methionine-dependent methyltransferase [Neolentinus lepideus HHB14362 ss-1]|uniref:S-adenosyl-L-methionine-dependent methyltransferase n=1 Tax=Neolentinus lepideus HHB14362 ss-1 TaxID=1314782 RepID=A0A165M813_9AGAM|nr:S-adenosyl-L-methionine-dependent methyltransferase [Neolentinus lepideus HHB14362 ss-1]